MDVSVIPPITVDFQRVLPHSLVDQHYHTPLQKSGMDSSSTVALRIFISQITTASPPVFRCSAMKPSGSHAFLFSSLATVLDFFYSEKDTQ